MSGDPDPGLLPEVRAYYDGGVETDRLQSGPFKLEDARTREILGATLPAPPAVILDVGGGPGVYAAWLAGLGHEVHLVDPVPAHVLQAAARSRSQERPIAGCLVGDARRLAWPDGSVDVVLLLGPLYHLPERGARLEALHEARRVLRPDGLVIAAAISRFASALDGLTRDLFADARFAEIARRDLEEGQHRNDTGDARYFTTAYFHRPEDLQEEIEAAGFACASLLGVEGPGWLIADFDAAWRDRRRRDDLLRVARAVESEPSIRGASAHLIAVGRKRLRGGPGPTRREARAGA